MKRDRDSDDEAEREMGYDLRAFQREATCCQHCWYDWNMSNMSFAKSKSCQSMSSHGKSKFKTFCKPARLSVAEVTQPESGQRKCCWLGGEPGQGFQIGGKRATRSKLWHARLPQLPFTTWLTSCAWGLRRWSPLDKILTVVYCVSAHWLCPNCTCGYFDRY